MKVAIVGSRDFKNIQLVIQYVNELPIGTEVVSGGGGIVDITAAKTAQARSGLPEPTIFPANWAKYGKSAGHIRNSQIAKYADRCVAFWDNKSKGTLSTINKFESLCKQVVIITSE